MLIYAAQQGHAYKHPDCNCVRGLSILISGFSVVTYLSNWKGVKQVLQSEATPSVATFKHELNEALRGNLLLILDARLQTEVK
jgi:hypothetical protein